MGILKGKTDAGQGGKRGHSNMDHWVFNDEIKEASRKRRRIDAKKEVAERLVENEKTRDDNVKTAGTANEFSK